jgi:hypothetical protein
MVTLDGSASTDADGTIGSYSWTQIAGQSVTLQDATTATPAFTAPEVSSEQTLSFELTVTDDAGASASATVQVTVSPVDDSDTDTFTDDFSDGSLSEYVAVQGEKSAWEIDSKLDGNTLNKMMQSGATALVLDPQQYSFDGERTISVDFRSNPSVYKKNAQVVFYSNGKRWVVHAAVQGDSINLMHPNKGFLSKEPVQIADDERHTLEVHIDGPDLTVSLDGTQQYTYTHNTSFGSGTVGVGTGGPDIEQETWFDNLRVETNTTENNVPSADAGPDRSLTSSHD